jgi:hypothetical protein
MPSQRLRQDQLTSRVGTGTGGGGGAVSSVNGKTGEVVLNKSDIGLQNVDNTSDANKPISNATQAALNGKQDVLDLEVVTSIAASADGSTTTLTSTRTNLDTESTSTADTALPVASATAAGVMNSATFATVQDNQTKINAMEKGSVVISGLSATPTQAELTTAWQTATGLTTVINTAHIWDSTNTKEWTYYTNASAWQMTQSGTSGGGGVSVSIFTNTQAGIIKGSTTTGQVFAESDGTGSINGWDALNTRVNNKQEKLTAGTNITISADNTISSTGGGVTSVNTRTGAVTLSKSDVGLNNVDNTSDADKPVSTATASAIDYEQQLRSQGDAALQSKLDKAMGVVVHLTDGTVARPTGFTCVVWVGSADPTNKQTNDLWIDTNSVIGGPPVWQA